VKNHIESLLLTILLSVSWATYSAAQRTDPAVVGKPVINYFNVAPAGILSNQAAILTMSVSGATRVNVTFKPCSSNCTVGTGQPIATILLNPTVTTTYTVEAKNAAGTVASSQTVEVGKYDNNPPPVPHGLTVTWGKACWYNYGGQRYQAVPLDSQIPTPPGGLPIEATLYYGSTTCNGADGTDNLNDLQTLIYSGGFIFFFTNHPNITGSSAIWTLGNQSSGCVEYAQAPTCN
jgi:hypothetical protein